MPAIGSSTQPVYVDENGNAKPCVPINGGLITKLVQKSNGDQLENSAINYCVMNSESGLSFYPPEKVENVSCSFMISIKKETDGGSIIPTQYVEDKQACEKPYELPLKTNKIFQYKINDVRDEL